MTKRDKSHIDPEQARFYQHYPQFPGVSTCLTLLRSGKAKGIWIDLICMELCDYAVNNADEIVGAFRTEPDIWVKVLLLSSVAEAASSDFIPLLQENLYAEQDSLRYWSEFGLKKIDTKESRTILWQFRQEVGD